MPQDNSSKGAWEDSHFLVRSLLVGAFALIPGIIFLWWSTAIPQVDWSAFLAGVSSTLISVGIIGIIYEAYLKRALLRDIQSASRLENRLLETGLTDATLEPEPIHYRKLLGTATRIDIVPGQPLTWRDSNHSWLERLLAERPLTCRIFLPEPNAYSESLRLWSEGDDILTGGEHCSAKFREYEHSWKAGAAKSGSRIEVLYYRGSPRSELVVADDVAIVTLASPDGADSAGRMSYVYEGKSARESIIFLRQGIERLNAAPVHGATADTRTAEEILPLTSAADPSTIGESTIRDDEQRGTSAGSVGN